MIVGLVGILKAGGAFLPLDPGYPRDRLEYMLHDSGARILLTQEHLKEAIPGQPECVVFLDGEANAYDSLPDTRPESDVCPSNLAYVIYTSGSTGTPKGVMVEHRNLTNLVRAHNPEFRIGPESRVIQMLSLSFDAGVGEIFRALAGGATLVLAQKEDLLPGPGLVAILRDRHITTAAVAPAVLAAMPAGAENSLPELAVLTTAGEAFSPDLAMRWGRGRRIITGHGATETTVGDTIAIDWDLERKPPLGRPLANMRVYVLDPWLQPVPVGTPGELYVSGPQVSRGYLNSPAMTAARFMPDPFSDQPAQRMYRTGDMVRWLGDGNLDFIGRTDHQVKIRGFRIELGEIEAVLAEHEQVSQCVVTVLAEGAVKRLAAYVVPKESIAPSVAELRAYLKERLPEHMVPAFLVLIAEMPLNSNNKIDRKALPRPDMSAMTLETQYVEPRTDTERALAAIWAEVLGLGRVGINDNFFELGGDSIMSIQLVARATKAAMPLAPRDIFQFQTVASLAEHVDAGGSIVAAEQGVVTGDVPLTPVQSWFFEAAPKAPHHYNQWLSRPMPGAHNPKNMAEALRKLLEHHDGLRLRFENTGDGWRQWMAPMTDDIPFSHFDLSGVAADEQSAVMDARVNELQARLDLADGPIIRGAWFDFGGTKQGNLVVIVHHLVMDNVSWPIILEDFFTAYRQLRSGQEVRLQPKTTSFKAWAETLQRFARSEDLQHELPYWLDPHRFQAGHLPMDRTDGGNTKASADSIIVELDEATTETLLRVALKSFQVQINDILLTALGTAVSRWTGKPYVVVTVEGHGREDMGEDTNISRTVGWFTSFYPVLLEIDAGAPAVTTLAAVRDQLQLVPRRGIGYSVLRYMSSDPETREQLARLPDGDIAFNYTGQQTGGEGGGDRPKEQEGSAQTGEPKGAQVRLSENEEGNRRHPVEIVGGVAHGRLSMRWSFSRNLHNRETIERVAADFIDVLRIIAVEAGSARSGKTSDLPSPQSERAVEV
jgi:amino acid adenylation domain-containing protein/non-ribosomal peptide synthase protein (TIGR01720 family)